MNETMNDNQPWMWWRLGLLILVLMGIVLVSGFMLTGYWMARRLGAEVVKIDRAGEPLSFEALSTDASQSSGAGDATEYYIDALLSARPEKLGDLRRLNSYYRRSIVSLPVNQFPEEVREKVAHNLNESQGLLKKLDEGADFGLPEFDIGVARGMDVCKNLLLRVQTAASLLSLRTLELIARGEDNAAAESVISMLKMMRIFDFHPTMLVYGVKLECLGIANQDVRLLLEHCRPSDESLAKLQKSLSETIGDDALERMFLAERVYQLEVARNLIPRRVVLRVLGDNAADLSERLSLPGSRWGRLRVRRSAARYFRDVARLVAIARLPWPGPLDATMDYLPDSPEEPSTLLSSGAGFVRFTSGIVASTRCGVLAIAVERYRRFNGRLPTSLEDLLPAYVDSIPLDPFSGGKLLYSHDEESYTVYSVGGNRQDDGGFVVPEADKRPEDRGIRIRFSGLK